MNMDRRLAQERARRAFGLPKPKGKPEQVDDEDAEVVPYFVFDEKYGTQISEANLDPKKDIVVYIKLALMTPKAVSNVTSGGKSLVDHASKQKGVFIIALKEDIGDVIKTLVDDAVKDKK